MGNLTLYELTDEYLEAMAVLSSSDADEQTIADTLEGLSGAVEVKATNVAMMARSMEATADAIKQAEAEMAKRRKAVESGAARLRDYLLANMKRAAIQKIECPYFTLAIRKNPASVVIDDYGAIPEKFMRQPVPPLPTPDKKAIAEALKAGKEVAGAHLEQSERLHIG